MIATRRLPFLLFVLAPFARLGAAPGDVDATFAPVVEVPSVATAIAFEPTGNLVVSGPFESVGGEARNGIARLLPDGRLDTGFVPDIRFFDGQLPSAACWRSDRFFVHLKHPGAAGRNWVLLDGSGRVVDDSLEGLDPDGVPAPAPVRATLARDGILTVGQGSRMHRFLPDGSRDGSFTVATGRFGDAARLLPAPDGKTYVVDAATARVSRILADGSNDADFEIDAPASALPHNLAVRADGSLLRAGLLLIDWQQQLITGELVRHEGAQGEVEASLPTLVAGPFERRFLLWREDGSILVPDNYSVGNGLFLSGVGMTRFLPDGTIDSDFTPPEEIFDASRSGAVVMDALERVIIDGTTRLLPDGNVDGTFAVPGGIWKGGEVKQLESTADRRLLVLGSRGRIDGMDTSQVAKLHMNGLLDNTFALDSRISGEVSRILPLADGGALLTTEEPVEIAPGVLRSLVKITPGGDLDPAFVPVRHESPQIDETFPEALAVEQPDGKILAWVAGRRVQEFVSRSLVRLLPDGSPDPTFSPPGYFDASINEITPLDDGSTLLSGRFRPDFAGDSFLLERLLPDGTPDPDFERPPLHGTAQTHLQMDDGGTLVALPECVLCFGEDGSFDRSLIEFVGGTQIADLGMDLGAITISGDINVGTGCLPVARVLPNGLLDATFRPEPMLNFEIDGNLFALDERGLREPGEDVVNAGGVPPLVRNVVFDDSGNLVLGGRFRTIGETGLTGLARLEGGMPRNFADWRAAVFREGPASASEPDRDPNGNGLDNWLEYALGRDPLSAAAGPQSFLEVLPGRVALSFNPFADDVQITVQRSTDLVDWEDFAMVEERTGRLVGEFEAGSSGYFRVVAAAVELPAP